LNIPGLVLVWGFAFLFIKAVLKLGTFKNLPYHSGLGIGSIDWLLAAIRHVSGITECWDLWNWCKGDITSSPYQAGIASAHTRIIGSLPVLIPDAGLHTRLTLNTEP
jgi:hypothetical protein